MASSISGSLADDAVSARRARSFSGSESWGASDGSLDRTLGNLAYVLCCSVPAIFRQEFQSHRHSVPVERLHLLVDALIPICATVMFAKYFTEVGEAQQEQEYELCHAAQEEHRRGDDACDVCSTPELWLFAGSAVAAMVAGAVAVFGLWQKAPVAAREVVLLAAMVFAIGSGFGWYCHAYNKSQEASFCFVMMILSLLCGFRAAYRYFARDSIAKRRWQDSHSSPHDGENTSAQVQERQGQQHDEESNYAASIRTTSAGILVVCTCIGVCSAIDLFMDDGIFRYTSAACDNEKDGCQWMDIFKVWLTTRSAAQASVAQHLGAHASSLTQVAHAYMCVLEVCVRMCVQIMWVGRFDKFDKRE